MGNMKSVHEALMEPLPYKITPDPRAGPSFDPMLGFPNGRKERVLYVKLEGSGGGSPRRNEHAHTMLFGLLKGKCCRLFTELRCTKEDLENWQVPKEFRDYCAPDYIEAKKCFLQSNRFERIFYSKCRHEVHVWHQCVYDDKILAMKEYERERRLQARQKRRIASGLEEDPNLVQTEDAEIM